MNGIQTRKVLYINTPTYLGGSEISLLTLANHLERNKFQPIFLTSGDGEFSKAVENLGIAVNFLELPWFSLRQPWKYWLSIYKLVRLIAREKIDLVHTNCDHSLTYVARASELSGFPYVSHVRDFERSWFHPNKVAALQRAHQVIVNSKAVAEACIEAGLSQNRLKVIYNPFDLSQFVQTSEHTRNRVLSDLEIPGDSLIIGIVGQIQPIKGHQEFIQAAIELAKANSQVHFFIVGAEPPGEDSQKFSNGLISQVEQSNYSNHIHFLGFRKDIADVMQSIDILTVPSWREPFGRVVVEGMAAGCAVIGTNAGGIPEIITDGVNGMLIPPKDEKTLLRVWSEMIENKELRDRMAAAGRIRANDFKACMHVRQIQDLYTEILR